MCGSMADIQSAAAEISRGKKEDRRTNYSMKYICIRSALFDRATIKEESLLVFCSQRLDWYNKTDKQVG